jgi:hypothetical protein
MRYGLRSQAIDIDLLQGTLPKSADVNLLITRRNQELPMLDVLMLALGLGFFALAIGYSYACERL